MVAAASSGQTSFAVELRYEHTRDVRSSSLSLQNTPWYVLQIQALEVKALKLKPTR